MGTQKRRHIVHSMERNHRDDLPAVFVILFVSWGDLKKEATSRASFSILSVARTRDVHRFPLSQFAFLSEAADTYTYELSLINVVSSPYPSTSFRLLIANSHYVAHVGYTR